MLTLLATDLDGTLVGDDSSLIQLNKRLTNLRQSGHLKLVYVTGRSLEMFNELSVEKDLLEPDALITAVGSEIYLDNVRKTDWPKVHGWSIQRIANVLSGYPGLLPQPSTEQRDYKLCYYYVGTNESIVRMQVELGNNYSVIYSSNRYLDILPAGINKGSALKQLCCYWNLPLSSVIAAGDSGNDITMLASYKAIIVGNASEELRQWQLISKNKDLFTAQADCAGGIEEGLRHYGLISDQYP